MVDCYTKPTKTVERLFRRRRVKRHEELKMNLLEINGYIHELSASAVWRATRKDLSTRIIGTETLPARFFSRPKATTGFFLISIKENIPCQSISTLIKIGGGNERLHL